MKKYLKYKAEDYRQAVSLYKVLREKPGASQQEQDIIDIVIDALRFAALRAENPPLTIQHLKEMHGQPVYCKSLFGGKAGGGIVDAKKKCTVLLDHDGVWCDTWGWDLSQLEYRFPINGIDLLG